jgi:iron complex outermembrane receptor protein
VRNQIGLSENIPVSGIAGVSAARFFLNGLASTTKGIDAVANYKLVTDSAGTFDLTVAGNVNDIKVTKVPTSTLSTLFARSRILTIEDGTPGTKVSGTAVWTGDTLGATARVTYYGNVLQPGTVATSDLNTGKRAITDLELRYQPKDAAFNFALGASNLFDVYPKKVPAALNTTGVTGFPYYSPYGFNGRYLYVRAGLSW